MVSNNLVENFNYNNLHELHRILSKAEASISFWGTRQVKIESKTYALRDIAHRVIDLGVNQNNMKEIPVDQRREGHEVANLLRKLYDQTRCEEKKLHFLTRVFRWFQDVFCERSPVRYDPTPFGVLSYRNALKESSLFFVTVNWDSLPENVKEDKQSLKEYMLQNLVNICKSW